MLQLSHSQMKLYEEYPLDYFYRYILKLKEKDQETKWMNFGSGVHKVLEDYYDKSNLDWQTNALIQWKKYKLDGRMNFDEFKKNIIHGITLGLSPTEIEKKILLSVSSNVTFLGYLDVYSDKEDYIIDWKTGTYTKQKEDDYRKQLLCYAWMFYEINNRLPKVCSIYFTKQSKRVDFTFTLNDVKEFEEKVKRISSEIIRKKALHKKAEQWGNELSYWSGYHHLDNLPTLNYKITILDNNCYLSGALSPLLINGIDKATYFDLPNKYFIQKAVMAKGSKVKNIEEIGRIHLFNKRTCGFNLGLLSNIKKLLVQYGEHKNCGISINEIDERDKKVHRGKLNLHGGLFTDKVLRPYQLQAVSSFLRSEGLGFLEVATGGGKTLITAEIIRRLNTKTLWIVDKKELLYQTKEEFEKVLAVPIGIIGDGEYDPKDITVATIQSLYSKCKLSDGDMIKYLLTINFVIVDESHHSASSSYINVFQFLRNTKYRLGTTATARRDDGMDPIMFSLLGPIIYKIGAQELIKQGYLVRPKITFYKIEDKLDKSEGYADEYNIGIVENKERNSKIFEVVNKYNNKKMLIITKIVSHGTFLHNNIKDSYYIHGSLNKVKRKKDFEEFKKSKSGILIATSSIASEGLDIPDLQAIINVSANKSDVKSIQALGRILRKIEGKVDADYIDFLDKGRYGRKHSRARIKIFKDDGYNVVIK